MRLIKVPCVIFCKLFSFGFIQANLLNVFRHILNQDIGFVNAHSNFILNPYKSKTSLPTTWELIPKVSFIHSKVIKEKWCLMLCHRKPH